MLKETRQTYAVFALIVCGLAIVTFGSLSTHLFDTDDHEWLQETPVVLANPSAYFSPDKHMPVRPLVDLLFAAGYLIWGENAGAFHLVLVGLHILVTLVMAYTLRCLGMDVGFSMLAAILFLMNVAHFRAVHWITIYTHVLAALFGLFVLIFYARYLEDRQRRWLIYSLIAFMIAIFSHPAIVSLSLFLAYFTWRKTGEVKQAFVLSGGLIVAAGVGVFATYALSFQSPQARGVLNVLPDPVAVGSNLLWFLSRLFTNAHWFGADIGKVPMVWELWVGAGFCACLVVLLWRKVFPAADWAVWCFVMVLPFIHRAAEFQFLPLGPSRQLYISTIGSSVVLACQIFWCGQVLARFAGERWRLAVVGGITAGIVLSSYFSLKTSEAASLYLSGRSYIARDRSEIGSELMARALLLDPTMVPADTYLRLGAASFTLGIPHSEIFEAGVTKEPNNPWPLMMLGVSMHLNDDPSVWKQGNTKVQRAISMTPYKTAMKKNVGTMFFNVGLYYLKGQNYERAIPLFQEAFAHRPDYPLAYFSLGNAFYMQKEFAKAIASYRQAIKVQPEYVLAYQNLGRALGEQGNYDAALEILRKGILLESNRAVLWFLVSQNARQDNQLDLAHGAIQNAVKIEPGTKPFWLEYIQVIDAYEQRGQIERALSICKDLVQQAPNLPQIYVKLGVLFFKRERYEDAVSAFEQALAFLPDMPQVQALLDRARQKKK